MEYPSGTLFIVSTPIGNLKDITVRAIEVLREVDGIIAEDTRHSKRLLDHYDIETEFTTSYYQGAEDKIPHYIQLLRAGNRLALISDAGTPLISDPGYKLIRSVLAESFPVHAIPGPSAMLAALTVSGQPTDSFIFDGMLPKKKTQKENYFEELTTERRTVILYDSPHRLKDTLRVLAKVLPERQLTLCRELTKRHEETLRGTSEEVKDAMEKRDSIKGELTLVIAGASEEEIRAYKRSQYSDLSFTNQLKALQEIKNLSRKEAMNKVAELRGMSKNQVYEKVLEEKENH